MGVFEGTGRGPDLVLEDSTDFNAVLARDGAIRSARSSADDGIARTTLRYGGEHEFAKACHVLSGR